MKRQSLSGFKTEVEDLKSDFDKSLGQRINAAEMTEKIQKLSEKANSFQQNITDGKKKVNNLHSELGNFLKNAKTLQSGFSDSTIKLGEIESNLRKSKMQETDIMRVNSLMKINVAELQTVMNKMRSKLSEMRHHIETARNLLNADLAIYFNGSSYIKAHYNPKETNENPTRTVHNKLSMSVLPFKGVSGTLAYFGPSTNNNVELNDFFLLGIKGKKLGLVTKIGKKETSIDIDIPERDIPISSVSDKSDWINVKVERLANLIKLSAGEQSKNITLSGEEDFVFNHKQSKVYFGGIPKNEILINNLISKYEFNRNLSKAGICSGIEFNNHMLSLYNFDLAENVANYKNT